MRTRNDKNFIRPTYNIDGVISSIVDHSSVALFLTDDLGHLLFNNIRAGHFLKKRNLFVLRGGRLASSHSRDYTRHLREAIAAATDLFKPRYTVLRFQDEEAVNSHCILIGPAPAEVPVAVISIIDLENDSIYLWNLLLEGYRLTRREGEITKLLLESFDVPEISRALGIRKTTTRIHLNRIFEKTSTKRQSQLIIKILKYPNIIFHDMDKDKDFVVNFYG